MEEKLKEIHELLGRANLNKNEEWMFFNYWNKPDYEFREDGNGKLSVHLLSEYDKAKAEYIKMLDEKYPND